MSNYNDLTKAQENRYVHEAQQEFKAIARRNKLLGLWAAAKLGKTGDDANNYAKDVVMADLDNSGENDVIDKLLKDFGRASVAVTITEINAEMARLLPIAKQQILLGN